MRSSASAFLIKTPASAPLPIPTIIDIGVASPKAQGQAIIKTLTAAIKAWLNAGTGPKIIQTIKVRTETSITAGTNHPATISESLWIGARLRCASETI